MIFDLLTFLGRSDFAIVPFLAIEGAYLTARQALKSGIACHVGGGTHHAHRDHGLGFVSL